MTLLHLKEISRFICDTDKGVLKLKLRKEETDYFFTLDATELDKNTNKEIMELLFPKIKTSFDDLKNIVDNGTTYINVGKVIHGGKDITEAYRFADSSEDMKYEIDSINIVNQKTKKLVKKTAKKNGKTK